ncbi:hypothetical protein Taro_000070 [Colocasia esculenta]|uniref:Uncharacterized protein n=1 Tax=Colocasia esculenta TaxID=4460 RepID=A0A843TDU1_COLES|nr:hypothetical protein [Colocasia esculenta]
MKELTISRGQRNWANGQNTTQCTQDFKEFLAAGRAGDPHTKPFFFPFSSAATYTNHPLEVDQSTLCQYKAVLDRNPRTCPFSVRFRRRPCEHDGSIGRVLRSCRDGKPVTF